MYFRKALGVLEIIFRGNTWQTLEVVKRIKGLGEEDFNGLREYLKWDLTKAIR